MELNDEKELKRLNKDHEDIIELYDNLLKKATSKKVNKKIIEDVFNKTITEKTHDGTSMGKLQEPYKEFNRKYGGLDHEELSLFDENGKEIFHAKGENHRVEVTDEDIDRAFHNHKETHVNHNHPTSYGNVPVYLSLGDTANLTEKIGDSYVHRSISATAENGSTMTLLRNNKFNTENEGDFNKARRLLSDVCQEYYSQYRDKVLDYMMDKAVEYQHETGKTIKASVFEKEAEEYVQNNMDSLEDKLEYYGVFQDFEKCNTKLRVTWVK